MNLWPLTVALLAAWSRRDVAPALDVERVVLDVSRGYADTRLEWTRSIDQPISLRGAAVDLLASALRRGGAA